MCSGSRHHFADVGKMGWSLVWAVEPGGLVGQGFDGSRMPLRGGHGGTWDPKQQGGPDPRTKNPYFPRYSAQMDTSYHIPEKYVNPGYEKSVLKCSVY